MTHDPHPLRAETARIRQALLEATTNSAFLIDADGVFLAANEIGDRFNRPMRKWRTG